MTIEHKDAHDQNVMPKVRVIDLNIGSDTEIISGGKWLETYSIIDDTDSLIPNVPFNDTDGAIKAVFPFSSAKQNDVLLQSDESAEKSGTELIFYFPEMENYLITDYAIKGGATQPTTNVLIEFYRGASAGDIQPGNKFFEATVPFADWPSQGAEAKYSAETYSSGDWAGKKQIPFSKDKATIVKFTCTTTLSLKVNIGQTLPWYKADLYVITERVALDQFTTRTPHTQVVVDTTGGAVTFPLILGRTYMDNLTEAIPSNLFTFVKDSVNGDYYQYDGDESALFDGNTSLGAVSNTTNAEVIPGIDIERFNGDPNEIQFGPTREFDGANDGNLSFPTFGTLNNGDKVRLFIDCNKAAPSFQITFFRKLVRKVP